jgi:hypothetical protein
LSYRVRRGTDINPIDNTYPLIPHVKMGEATYYQFISMGYLPEPVSDEKTLIAEVASQQPHRLFELEEVLRRDRGVRTRAAGGLLGPGVGD